MKFNKVKIINYYFDITPLKYFTGIITENGINPAEKILKLMINKKIYKKFL